MKWISVSNEMPTGQPRLLTGIDAHGERWYACGYFNRMMRTWLVNGEWIDGLEPTHWMPLPDPPEGQ